MKTTGILKYLTLIMITLISFSCATVGDGSVYAPQWYKDLEEGIREGCVLIKVSSSGLDKAEAATGAGEELLRRITETGGQEDLYAAGKDREELLELIASLIDDDTKKIESFGWVHRQEWVSAKGRSFYFGAFCLAESAPQWLEERIIEQYYGSDPELKAMLERADELEALGQSYGAAEELLRAAVLVKGRGLPLEDKTADGYIARAASLLEGIDVRIGSVPAQASVNRRVEPFHLYCGGEDDPMSAVEFLVQYQGRKRNGRPGQFERRLVSNETGRVEFYHPFIPFAGSARVVFTVGSREFHSSLAQLEERGGDVSSIRRWLEESRLEHSLSVVATDRKIPTGVVILHADITGQSLELSDAAAGVVEELVQAGFDVKQLNLNPVEIAESGEREFLRDLKAVYGADFDRILFGVVEIRDFEVRDSSYRVATAGFLRMADIETGEILYSLEQDKSVESRNDGLAVSASFRELGKAFAQDLITALD